ncbi:DoxX family protein [Asticcacaulis sp. BYS171W]|uniref:DoxX family protein n=1 Tax=Asticcacaulis aquaticus TaxID=2984212 RepID=A0ABT5HVU9_9CAUL|nr:DoxX family protein [Asticcacaulis aquaticus]MDC7684211.1 DoxX family protein [Asticcacaulis aquaticus]
MSKLESVTPAFARLLIAAIFILSGLSKLAAPEGTIGYIASVGLPFPELAYVGAVAVEILGGLVFLVGYQTRLVSLALAAFTVATAVFFHSNLADQNQFIHFMKNISIAGGFLYAAVYGGGVVSLDHWLANRHKTRLANA